MPLAPTLDDFIEITYTGDDGERRVKVTGHPIAVFDVDTIANNGGIIDSIIFFFAISAKQHPKDYAGDSRRFGEHLLFPDDVRQMTKLWIKRQLSKALPEAIKFMNQE